MNIKEIREIVALMNENEITEFVIEREDFKLRIKKGGGEAPGTLVTGVTVPVAQAAVAAETPPQAPVIEEGAEEEKGGYIVSPMVGTFYSAASPDSPPFVEIGQTVDENTVVCIIEAMKVMNEIKAEKKGKIVEVLVENGEPVEYGKRLFKIV